MRPMWYSFPDDERASKCQSQYMLGDAILVNPHDIEGSATAISRAFNMPLEERRQRMCNLRESIKNQDVFWWLNSFLNATRQMSLSTFPKVDEYIPGNFPGEFMNDYW